MKRPRRMFFTASAALAMAAGCASSHETRRADLAVPAPQSQSAYTDYASDQLSYFRNHAKELPDAERSRYAAAVRDAQVTLDQLKHADGATWRTYRTRMEDSLAHLERVQRQAKLDR